MTEIAATGPIPERNNPRELAYGVEDFHTKALYGLSVQMHEFSKDSRNSWDGHKKARMEARLADLEYLASPYEVVNDSDETRYKSPRAVLQDYISRRINLEHVTDPDRRDMLEVELAMVEASYQALTGSPPMFKAPETPTTSAAEQSSGAVEEPSDAETDSIPGSLEEPADDVIPGGHNNEEDDDEYNIAGALEEADDEERSIPPVQLTDELREELMQYSHAQLVEFLSLNLGFGPLDSDFADFIIGRVRELLALASDKLSPGIDGQRKNPDVVAQDFRLRIANLADPDVPAKPHIYGARLMELSMVDAAHKTLTGEALTQLDYTMFFMPDQLRWHLDETRKQLVSLASTTVLEGTEELEGHLRDSIAKIEPRLREIEQLSAGKNREGNPLAPEVIVKRYTQMRNNLLDTETQGDPGNQLARYVELQMMAAGYKALTGKDIRTQTVSDTLGTALGLHATEPVGGKADKVAPASTPVSDIPAAVEVGSDPGSTEADPAATVAEADDTQDRQPAEKASVGDDARETYPAATENMPSPVEMFGPLPDALDIFDPESPPNIVDLVKFVNTEYASVNLPLLVKKTRATEHQLDAACSIGIMKRVVAPLLTSRARQRFGDSNEAAVIAGLNTQLGLSADVAFADPTAHDNILRFTANQGFGDRGLQADDALTQHMYQLIYGTMTPPDRTEVDPEQLRRAIEETFGIRLLTLQDFNETSFDIH